LFAEKAAAMGINIGQVEITPPTVPIVVSSRQMMAEIAEEGGRQFVPVAPETIRRIRDVSRSSLK
jgi:hypothetical protein